MNQCPVCGTIYTDATLRFCLTDGAALTKTGQETVELSHGKNPVRIDIPSQETIFKVEQPAPQKRSGFPIVKVLLALAVLGVIIVGAAGIVGAFLYFNMGGTGANQNTRPASPTPAASPSPSASQSPTVDPEKQRLQDELANVQKKLDEQKNANHAVNIPAFPTPPSQPGVVTARVNSPADGFLAMRSGPSAEYGERVAKIPHGAVVTIENCERNRVRIGDRTGRWCMVTYGDHVGWVFDAWLDY